MPGVQRQGDTNTAGGVAKSGVASVRVNGRPIVVNGISVSPHPCCGDRKSTRLNSSHSQQSRMPSSA